MRDVINGPGTIAAAMMATLIAAVFFVSGTSASIDIEGRSIYLPVPAVIYDNGPLSTGSIARNGTAAPTGTQWSELSYDYGSVTENNTVTGFGCQLITGSTFNRCADDFYVPAGQTWTIDQVIVFVYQTNYFGTSSPVVGASLRIWKGRPGDQGSTVIFGDTDTNRLGTSTDALMYRTANSGPPTNPAPGTSRKIWQNNIIVAPAAKLGPGSYWIDFQVDAGSGGNFTPSATITGIRSFPGWNARQYTSSNGVWNDLVDTGNPVAAADVPQDLPFKLTGIIEGVPAARSRVLDFNGDGRTDLVVARSSSVSNQSVWWTNDGTHVAATAWGLGIGFAGGDIATPRDFDGDGKTDFTVWRSDQSDPDRSYFYTLRSSDSTLSAVQFGRVSDDPTIVDDYDGDGNADYAVFRAVPIANDPCGTQSVWYYKPSGSPSEPSRYICWGTSGDRPLPGDFDGDAKADFVVVRNSGGSAIHFQNLSGGSVKVFNYGLSSDKFVSADFDGDGRTDLCAVRNNGSGQYDWYVTYSGNAKFFAVGWGSPATDLIVPGDYDGDGRSDFVVWRSGPGPDNGYFYEYKSFSSPLGEKFGSSAAALTAPDYPVANGIGVH